MEETTGGRDVNISRGLIKIFIPIIRGSGTSFPRRESKLEEQQAASREKNRGGCGCSCFSVVLLLGFLVKMRNAFHSHLHGFIEISVFPPTLCFQNKLSCKIELCSQRIE